MPNIPNLSFFITRKVRDIKDNIIWIECIKQIRSFYKYEPIIIIDDCNDKNLIININDIPNFVIQNIHIVDTQDVKDINIIGSGELASFYFYFKFKISKHAFFIQDNFFLLKPFDQQLIFNSDIRFLFGFIDTDFSPSLVNNLVLDLNHGSDILNYKFNFNWISCYGVSCLISLDYLIYLINFYNLFIFFDSVKSKLMREVFERVFGLLITFDKKKFNDISFFGLKGNYDYDLNNYLSNKNNLISNNIPYFNFHQHQLESP